MTPMQEQYNQIKEAYPDFIVLFRLGDFYEAFHDDAISLSKILGITLTARGKDDNKTPMAGIPYHALPTYMPKLVEASVKVAIADQVEAATPGKLVERKVTKVITPGTIMDEASLDSSKNNYISCVYLKEIKSNKIYFVASCDLTTGELIGFSTKNLNDLLIELSKINPSEVLVQETQFKFFSQNLKKHIEPINESNFEYNFALEILLSQLGVLTLKGFGIEDDNLLVIPSGILINYIKECQKSDLKHIKSIKFQQSSNFMNLDSVTIKNLELLYSIQGSEEFSLYRVLNKVNTAMGKRLLRKWILYPLVNKELLQERLDSVEVFFNDQILLWDLKSQLNIVTDIERLCGKVGVGISNPKELVALKSSLLNSMEFFRILKNSLKSSTRLDFIKSRFLEDSDLYKSVVKTINIINTSIDDNPPASLSEVGIIKTGFNKEVDQLRDLRFNAKKILLDIQKREIESSGISSLKISYNQVFGYYIEVTKSNIAKVPSHYIRKQTLANAERYITQELKELEDQILNAESKLLALEQTFFKEINLKVAEQLQDILEVSIFLAELDCYLAFAQKAKEDNYTKPILLNTNTLLIKDSRHPVVETLVKEFTPNSVEFKNDSLVHILTGPNMSGKSTYIRQVAILTLMAQIGSFVPASLMEFSLIDRIFTRVGASDNLSKGESTFMVEMTETANILNNATENSLVVLDEVGRGTSTYDGVAIAWSVIEYIVKELKCKTLFATHYHELISLDKIYSTVENYNVLVVEQNEEIVFKHKIVKGGTNKSYGVHVAKLAGIPDSVTKNANKILNSFESDSKLNLNSKAKSTPKPKTLNPEQINLLN